MKKILLYLSTLLIVTSINAQNAYIMKENIIDKQRVLRADSIIYLGADYSSLELVNPEKVGMESEITPIMPVFPRRFNAFISKKGSMEELFEKKIRLERVPVKRCNLSADSNWITNDRHYFKIPKVESILSSYDHLKGSYGTNSVGLLVLPEAFEKAANRVVLSMVFFDLNTRKVLWKIKASGTTRYGAFHQFWHGGIEKAYDTLHFTYLEELMDYQWQLRKAKRKAKRNK